MKIVVAIALAVVIIILAFTLMPTGADAAEITQGYSNTRQYATSNLQLINSADNYRETVAQEAAYREAEDAYTPISRGELGSYGTLLTDEAYETYTASLGSIPKSYPKGHPGAGSGGYGTTTSDKDIPVAAYFSKTENFLTKSGEPDADHQHQYNADNPTCRNLYEAGQCAGFADWYINEQGYPTLLMSNQPAVLGALRYNEDNTIAWESADTANGVSLDSEEDAVAFFNGITPGTFIRVDYSTNIHSYIVLGASDTDGLIIYDCNVGLNAGTVGKCAIRLRKLSWSDFVNTTWMSNNIKLIVAPEGTQLPKGCYNRSLGNITQLANQLFKGTIEEDT